MSTSTVSITANPGAARRRPVEKHKPGVDLIGADGVTVGSPSNDRLGIGDIGIGKDRSHSIRGETVLERSREHVAVEVKKPLPSSANGNVLPRRSTRKVVTKTEKPRWQRVVRVFAKNFLLLLVLAGFILIIRRWVLNSSNGFDVSLKGSDFAGRMAEMETFVKKTTKMMQVQVDVVDTKIEKEIGGLRSELGKKIEDQGSEFVAELEKLDGRTGNLEKALGELRSTEWLSKHDFDGFFEEFNKAKGIDSGSDVSLDEVRAFAREIVEKEIEKYAADGLGRVDYALASGGGMVVKHSEPYIVGKGSGTWFWRKGVHHDAIKMLRPSFGVPGECFPLKGNSGFVQIKLRTAIIPEAITLEHVAKSVAYDRSSAPKHCRVSGWLQGLDTTDLAVDTEKMFLLTEFMYDLEKNNAQTFNVLDLAASGVVDMIRLDFTSNHGSPSHTCIYRLRVHGHESNSVSMLAMES
ncbi:unnamed protein product [Ilex paraguariensis]|uniref:SUN domain-containing protein n=1 Tax=Ilex paraguariensis TaxID=185542 RepID=A0ABC8RDJ5_9AQUA